MEKLAPSVETRGVTQIQRVNGSAPALTGPGDNLIKEHKTGLGLEKMPPKNYFADRAWLLAGEWGA
jgi:hypothetical protein